MSVDSLSSVGTGIVPYLQDRELQSLGTTSQRMYAIARQELLNRDKRLEQLLASYTMTHRFNIQSLREVELFGISEYHKTPDCWKDQVSLVVFLASRGPVILILEGWPPLKPVPVQDDFLLTQIHSLIPPAHRNYVYGIGWDDQEETKKLDKAIDQEYKEQKERLDQDWNRILDLAKQELPEEFLLVGEDFDEALAIALSSGGDTGDFYSLLVQKILARGEGFISSVMDRIDGCPIEILQKIALLSEKLSVIAKLHDQVMGVFLEIQEKQDAQHYAVVKKTFPIRTKSMIGTVQALKALKAELVIPNAKAVLVAGGRHFNTKAFADESEVNDPEWDITPFHEELSHHRAAIVVPMELVVAKQAERATRKADHKAKRAELKQQREQLEQKRARELAESEAIQAAISERMQTLRMTSGEGDDLAHDSSF